MNNTNAIELTNENGAKRVYRDIPDLWHIAQQLSDEQKAAVLQVWEMAHDLKSVLEGQGKATITRMENGTTPTQHANIARSRGYEEAQREMRVTLGLSE